MSVTCPACGCSQPNGLLCSEDTAKLETMLAAVPAIVGQLNIAMSKQARLMSGGRGSKGATHERWPISIEAVEEADKLTGHLIRWAQQVGTEFHRPTFAPAITAAAYLLGEINNIRRHPDADKILYDIARATKAAYRHVDRMQEREYLGQCLYEEDDLTCHAEVWARPGAHQVTCTQCGITHEVGERRAWLLLKAADMIVTVREAASYIGEVGGITISQASIRGYVHRQKLAYRAPVEAKRFRLGDLLTVVLEESERKSA